MLDGALARLTVFLTNRPEHLEFGIGLELVYYCPAMLDWLPCVDLDTSSHLSCYFKYKNLFIQMSLYIIYKFELPLYSIP